MNEREVDDCGARLLVQQQQPIFKEKTTVITNQHEPSQKTKTNTQFTHIIPSYHATTSSS
jgi:hypothetical protein